MTKTPSRICHLTSVHPCTDIRIFVKECRTLAAAGYDTHLIAVGAPNETRAGVRLHGIPARAQGRLARMTQTTWAVARTAWALGADLYHFHDPELIPVGLWLRARGKRVIYDIHEDLPRDMLSKPYLGRRSGRLLAGPVELGEDFAARRFSGLITATPLIGARFQRLNPRTRVVNNYPLRDELFGSSQIAWGQREMAVAYTGVISAIRCLFEMVDALAYLPPHLSIKLELAGRFASAEQREQALRRPGWAAVRELGQLDRATMALMLGRVQAGLVLFYPEPNHINAQPNKLFEYMSAGLPVIGSHFPLWRELIQTAECGLVVDPLDPRAIAAAIERLLTNPAEAETMGRRGRTAIEVRFNWEHEATKLLGLYADLLESSPA